MFAVLKASELPNDRKFKWWKISGTKTGKKLNFNDPAFDLSRKYSTKTHSAIYLLQSTMKEPVQNVKSVRS